MKKSQKWMVGIAALFVLSGIGSLLPESEPAPKAAPTDADIVRTARVNCRMEVRSVAKYPDTIKYSSVNTGNVVDGNVSVQLNLTAKNAQGMDTPHKVLCVSSMDDVLFLSVDGNIIFDETGRSQQQSG
ncbi:hypothetical protein [Sansalvadorimonas verongulae]|uniref:hypothetical protein n=1 Tax=Sansalvadorimonas verongulae TaxID=2172824 RepID=UPI0012BC7646|nr:hypothetical protein [Sansalvadorimonas verongulae]MTI13432.1 hypothetical protein [Sansalvadorimonas verongulae]